MQKDNWRAEYHVPRCSADGVWRIVAEDSAIVAILSGSSIPAQDERNARLLAAAPLLKRAALKVIANWESGDLAAAVRELADVVGQAGGGGMKDLPKFKTGRDEDKKLPVKAKNR